MSTTSSPKTPKAKTPSTPSPKTPTNPGFYVFSPPTPHVPMPMQEYSSPHFIIKSSEHPLIFIRDRDIKSSDRNSICDVYMIGISVRDKKIMSPIAAKIYCMIYQDDCNEETKTQEFQTLLSNLDKSETTFIHLFEATRVALQEAITEYYRQNSDDDDVEQNTNTHKQVVEVLNAIRTLTPTHHLSQPLTPTQHLSQPLTPTQPLSQTLTPTQPLSQTLTPTQPLTPKQFLNTPILIISQPQRTNSSNELTPTQLMLTNNGVMSLNSSTHTLTPLRTNPRKRPATPNSLPRSSQMSRRKGGGKSKKQIKNCNRKIKKRKTKKNIK